MSRLVVVSNRVPSPGQPPTGGLAVVLRDALAGMGGLWFGWNGRASGPRGALEVCDDEGVEYVRVGLDERELDGYYRGFANNALWPLFHDRLDAVHHDRSQREIYDEVNRRFAGLLVPRLGSDDVVWVQDYHLIPLGRELRALGWSGRVGFFLHTPFPPFEVLRALPDHGDLIDAFGAYDVVGFQTDIDTGHFVDAAQRSPRVQASGPRSEVLQWGRRRVEVRTFPVGIDVEHTRRIAVEYRDSDEALGLLEFSAGHPLVVGADRLDYTKGLVPRLQAFERLLETHDEADGLRPAFAQVAAPSRTGIDQYQELAEELVREAGRINAYHNRPDWNPVRLIARSISRAPLLGCFSVADAGLVTPMRDGMNLVAKEFVASQPDDDPGVLVLSTLAGAALELDDVAVLVNPYDIDNMADGVRRALSMDRTERRRRHARGMDALRAHTAHDWCREFTEALRGPPPETAPFTPERRTSARE